MQALWTRNPDSTPSSVSPKLITVLGGRLQNELLMSVPQLKSVPWRRPLTSESREGPLHRPVWDEPCPAAHGDPAHLSISW